MKKLALFVPFLAAAALAGCATEEPRGTPGPVTSSGGAVVASGSAPVVSYGATPVVGRAVVVPAIAVRPGTGVVESVTAVPHMGSASAGASVPGNASRLGIRMSDGTLQYVDYESRDIPVGSRVELTAEGYIRRI
jgi:hypothetical protein